MYCDRDRYWGTNKSMFDKDWEKTFTYPGNNAFGICLEDVRKKLRPAGFIPTGVKDVTPVEMDTEVEVLNNDAGSS